MMNFSNQDPRYKLEDLMQEVGISSLEELSKKAGVSELQLWRLQQGLVLQTRVDILLKVSAALQITLNKLLNSLTSVPDLKDEAELELLSVKLAQEYSRLQEQMVQQKVSLQQEFQQSTLQILESWLLQWPTAVNKAQANPDLPALRLIPLVKPLERLLQTWGVQTIAEIGSEVPYHPQIHQLMEGNVAPGELVKIRYAGYKQGEKLLWRAKVSPVEKLIN